MIETMIEVMIRVDALFMLSSCSLVHQLLPAPQGSGWQSLCPGVAAA
jgi:hypothetical protein